jgi:hypothetical protein
MKIFELKDNQVVIDPEILTIPEFHTVWEADKTKGKEKAFQNFTYIYHTSDYASPYANYPADKREEAVRHDLIPDKKWKPAPYTLAAIDKYRQLSITPMMRLLAAAQAKVDQLADYLEGTGVTDETIKPILEIFNKLSLSVTNFGKLSEAVTKEQKQSNTKRRGEKSTSLFET